MTQRRVFILASDMGEIEREVIRRFTRKESFIFLTNHPGEKLPDNVADFHKKGGYSYMNSLMKDGRELFTVLINLNSLRLFHDQELVPWTEAVRETLHFTSEAIQNISPALKGGRIINVLPMPPVSDDLKDKYRTLRSGYIGLSDIWGGELGSREVTINTLVPGYFSGAGIVEDGKVMMGRAGKAAELASVIEFMASSGASYITNAAIPVDGGILF